MGAWIIEYTKTSDVKGMSDFHQQYGADVYSRIVLRTDKQDNCKIVRLIFIYRLALK